MKRCVVIAGVFPPAGGGGALRMVKLLKHLPANGFDVHVVAPRRRSGWFADPDLLKELDDVRITRVGLPSIGGDAVESVRRRAKDPGSNGLLHRALSASMELGSLVRDTLAIPDAFTLWSLTAGNCAREIIERDGCDVLITASFPYSCHLAGWWLKKRTGVPWLADFADPWTGQWMRQHDTSWRRAIAIDQRLEDRVLEIADAITVASPGMKRTLLKRKPALEGKVHELHNTFDPEEFVGAAPPQRGDRFEILFVGTLDARLTPPRPFVQALTLLHQRDEQTADRLLFRVLGGADRGSSEFIRRAHADGLPSGSLELSGYATHARAIAAMRRADALALSVADGAHWHLTAKVFEYLASRRPILAVVPDGDCRDLLSRAGGASMVRPGQIEQLAEIMRDSALNKILKTDTALDEEFLRELSAPVVAEGAAKLLHELAS